MTNETSLTCPNLGSRVRLFPVADQCHPEVVQPLPGLGQNCSCVSISSHGVGATAGCDVMLNAPDKTCGLTYVGRADLYLKLV
jgi:hypothetical protein